MNFLFLPQGLPRGALTQAGGPKVHVKTNVFFNAFKINEKMCSCIHLRFCSDYAVALPLKPPLYDPFFSSKVPFLNVPNTNKNMHPRCSDSAFWPKLVFPSERCCYFVLLTTPLGWEGQFWSKSVVAAARINILWKHEKCRLGPHLASSRVLSCLPLGPSKRPRPFPRPPPWNPKTNKNEPKSLIFRSDTYIYIYIIYNPRCFLHVFLPDNQEFS